jgi:hypothetical protein
MTDPDPDATARYHADRATEARRYAEHNRGLDPAVSRRAAATAWLLDGGARPPGGPIDPGAVAEIVPPPPGPEPETNGRNGHATHP